MDAVLSWWSVVLLGSLIWRAGDAAKSHVRANWSGAALKLYNRTVWAHPPLIGLLTLVPGFPLPEGVESTTMSRTLLGIGVGVFCAYLHRGLRVSLERKGRADA